MAKTVDMNGDPIIELDGRPWEQRLRMLEALHKELAQSISHDDYLCVETSVGTIEFHFK